jgi:hypothetical protein
MASDPDVAAALIAPVTGAPDVTMGRPMGFNLNLKRRRWGVNDDRNGWRRGKASLDNDNMGRWWRGFADDDDLVMMWGSNHDSRWRWRKWRTTAFDHRDSCPAWHQTA